MNYDIELNGGKRRVSIQPTGDGLGWQIALDGQECHADLRMLQPNVLSLLIEGKSYRILLDARPEDPAMVLEGERIKYQVRDPRSLRSRSNSAAHVAGAKPVTAPMPGRIVRVLVQAGESVQAQQGLIVIEAMKMQNELKAPKAGNITRIAVEAGATVQAGQVLLVIE